MTSSSSGSTSYITPSAFRDCRRDGKPLVGFGSRAAPEGPGSDNRVNHRSHSRDWKRYLQPVAAGDATLRCSICYQDAGGLGQILGPFVLEKSDFPSLHFLNWEQHEHETYLARPFAAAIRRLYHSMHPTEQRIVMIGRAVANCTRHLAHGSDCQQGDWAGGSATMLCDDNMVVHGTAFGFTLGLCTPDRTMLLAGLPHCGMKMLAVGDAERERREAETARRHAAFEPRAKELLAQALTHATPAADKGCQVTPGCSFGFRHAASCSGSHKGCTRDPACMREPGEDGKCKRGCRIPEPVRRQRKEKAEAEAATDIASEMTTAAFSEPENEPRQTSRSGRVLKRKLSTS